MRALSCSAANAVRSTLTKTADSACMTAKCRCTSGLSACPTTIPGYVSWPEYLQTRQRLASNVRPRGEGGGAAREGAALLQGLARCGRCGRRMQVGYSGTNGIVPRYLCVRGAVLHGTGQSCQSLGGGRLDQAIAKAFLEAVTPAAVGATAGALSELEDQHEQRLAGQRL